MALLSVWGILLVVLGHSGMAEPEIETHVGLLKTWIYSFHMPLFFFISGYLFSLTNPDFLKIKAGPFLFKKVKRLLVPYFILGLLSIFINLKGGQDLHLADILLTFTYPRELGYLWYVATLFIIFVMVTLLSASGINLKNKGTAVCLLLILFAIYTAIPPIYLLNISEVCWFSLFFALGILFQTNDIIIQRFVNKSYRGGVISLTVSFCLSILMFKKLIPTALLTFADFTGA